MGFFARLFLQNQEGGFFSRINGIFFVYIRVSKLLLLFQLRVVKEIHVKSTTNLQTFKVHLTPKAERQIKNRGRLFYARSLASQDEGIFNIL